MSTDRELVEAVLARRAGAFERLVREHQGLVAHIVFRVVRHADTVDELSQETFLRVHRRLHQFRHDSSLKAWIGRVAYTIALRHLEKQSASVQTIDDGERFERESADEDIESALSEREAAAMVREAVNALPPLQRTIVSLYHLEELSIPEIAEITALPAGTIKSHLFRTRRQLRETLEARLGVDA
jgi:RNA polymerase sigma-70 factor (ECF subfamily)